MPIKTENAAESLKPVRMGESPEHLLRTVFIYYGDSDLAGELDHALEKPGRGFAAVQGQVSDACAGGKVRCQFDTPKIAG